MKTCLHCKKDVKDKAIECPYCGNKNFELEIIESESKIINPNILNSNQSNKGIYSEKLESLIDMALSDGELSEKEKQVLFKKAELEGIDLDEFEMVLDAKLFEKQQSVKSVAPTTDAPPNPSAPKSDKFGDVKKCPACGAIAQSFQTKCSDCGHEFSNIGANVSIEKLFQLLIEAENQRKLDTSSVTSSFFGGIEKILQNSDPVFEKKKTKKNVSSYCKRF